MARLPYTDAEIPVNIFRILAHAPVVSKGFTSLGGRLLSQGALDAKIRELVIDAVAVQMGCEYEWSHHAQPALDAGATREDLAALRDGDHTALGELERACIEYATKVDERTVGDDDVAALRRLGLDEGQIVELTVLAGFYGMTARLLLAMDIGLDEGRPPGFEIP